MDTLPVEVLHTIFIQLHIRQRLECTLVCKKWAHILRTRSLFHTVIIETQLMCYRFMEMIERFPLRARHVEHLQFSDCFGTGYDKRKFCTIFPNLRIVKLFTFEFASEANRIRQKPVEFTLPSNQIEELADYDECELTYELIASGLCSRLTTLHLDIHFQTDSYIHFISSLKNLPALRKLTIEGLFARIDDMETIHKNIPSLEVLELDRCTLLPSFLPLDIKRISFKKLAISIEPDLTQRDRQIMWLDYIGAKYIGLTELSLWCENNEKYDVEMFGFYLQLTFVVLLNGPKLKSLPPLCPTFDRAMFLQLQDFKTQLTSCKFLSNSEYDCFTHLANSTQVESIEELHLCGLDYNRFDWLKKMKKLKKLQLTFSIPSKDEYQYDDNDNYEDKLHTHVLNMHEIIKVLPETVETLNIENVRLLTLSNQEYELPTIKEFNLKNVGLLANIDNVTGKLFPKLKILRFDDCTFCSYCVYIPTLDLSLLEITNARETDEMVNVNLVTLSNGKHYQYPVKAQSFFTKNIQPDLYISYNVNPPNPSFDLFFFKVVCNSVKTLIVNRIVYPSC